MLELPEFLRRGDVLVFNETRVVPARLRAKRNTTGGMVEVFLLPPDPNQSQAQEPGLTVRKALTRSGGRLSVGEKFTLVNVAENRSGPELQLRERLGAEGDIIGFLCTPLELEEWCRANGEVPLPPYIKRPAGPSSDFDRERYQTLFANMPGAVAAPTAGLHFSPELLTRVQEQGVEFARITLHVGPGTFKTVKAERAEDHVVDPEPFSISPEHAQTINRAKAEGRRVIAVGTTVLRTLESQWDAERKELKTGVGYADIFIHPPYTFKVADGLLSNFHLPKSSLLMLVSAFAAPGKTEGIPYVLSAYKHAVESEYRFFSYGDATLFV